jgi:hypothetical protein
MPTITIRRAPAGGCSRTVTDGYKTVSGTGSPPAVEATSDAEFDTRGMVTTTPLAADVNPSRAELPSKGAMSTDADEVVGNWRQSTLAVAGVLGMVADVDQEGRTRCLRVNWK